MPADICMHPWKYRVEPVRLAGPLYYAGNKDVSSHLIDTGEGLVLMDTAFPQSVYLLLESIRRLGFDPDDLRLILHCHGHYDHFGGTRALVELTGAKTAIGKQDIEVLTTRPELSWAPEYGVEFYETFKVDMPLEDGQRISMGGVEIDCMHIPGHTPGSISYFFDVEEQGKTFRVGINGGPGLNTLTTEYMEKYGLPMSRREDYMKSLRRMQGREVDIFIGAHPGQNGTLEKRAEMTDSRNPFIDRDAWPRFLGGLEAAAAKQFG